MSFPPATTDLPFPEAFAELRAARGVSLRTLNADTKALDASGKGLSPAHLSRLSNGRERPSPAAIALIARALLVAPEYFAEYRLAEARALLDERGPGGLETALEHWRRLKPLLARAPHVVEQHRPTRRNAA